MPKDEPVGETGLTEQRVLSGAWEKRRVYGIWKKGQAAQENYKDVIKLCKEKIKRAKAQLEFNLATVVQDNKNVFINTITKEG